MSAGLLELALAEVARGEGPGLIEHVDQHRGAELGQRLGGDRVGLEELLGLVDDELEALGIGDRGRWAPCPATTTALSFLAPITAPRPPRPMERPRLLTMEAKSTPRSPAGPMTAASHCGCSSRRRASEAGTSRPQTPAASCHSHAVGADRHVAGLVEGADDDEVVPAEAAEGVAPVAARVAVEHGTGERRAAGDAVAAARRGAGAREGSRREDQQVLGASGSTSYSRSRSAR